MYRQFPHERLQNGPQNLINDLESHYTAIPHDSYIRESFEQGSLVIDGTAYSYSQRVCRPPIYTIVKTMEGVCNSNGTNKNLQFNGAGSETDHEVGIYQI